MNFYADLEVRVSSASLSLFADICRIQTRIWLQRSEDWVIEGGEPAYGKFLLFLDVLPWVNHVLSTDVVVEWWDCRRETLMGVQTDPFSQSEWWDEGWWYTHLHWVTYESTRYWVERFVDPSVEYEWLGPPAPDWMRPPE